ncbi:hypothetical protein MCAP1_000791 [Malassezia caprae]|uniref:TFIIS N-terminal domain-containing protein n=1 Tax=Malassezia caprae TaxID=1381934 RepID=A0AAF0E9J4_9BASI|nr:hypothetical protein MCAP1_000791 [Malassezia caprae]
MENRVFHWSTPEDMVLLRREEIDAFLARQNRKRWSELYKAYEIAKDPTPWNEEQNRIVQKHEEWVQEHGEEQEADEAVGEDESAHPASRKRAPSETPAPAKRARSEPAEVPAETQPEKEHTEEQLDAATRKVREWRHRLQRAFLSKEGTIYASDMDAQDAIFTTVEAYDEMTVDQLRQTKICKVMKRIHLLPEVPRDDEFHFRERAGELMKRWNALFDRAAEDTETHS